MKRKLQALAGVSAFLMTAATASATCADGMYCSSSNMHAYEGGAHMGHATVAATSYAAPIVDTGSLSYSAASYGAVSTPASSYDFGTTTVGPQTYAAPIVDTGSLAYSTSSASGVGSYGSSSYYSGGSSYVASDSYADATYGTGSISSTYEDTSYVPFHGGNTSYTGSISGLKMPGLGLNEELCPVDCGEPAVGGKGRVLGCYAVCQPAPQPVVTTSYTQIVRPVIYVRYPVPYAVQQPRQVYGHYSRYGDHGHAQGYRANCSHDYGYHGHAGYGGYGCR